MLSITQKRQCADSRLVSVLASYAGGRGSIPLGDANGVSEDSGPGLAPYASGGSMGMINYAQTEQSCIRNVFTYFMEYLPYLTLLETISKQS